MNEAQARELLLRYRMGMCSAEETSTIEQWYDALADGSEWQWTPEQKLLFKAALWSDLAAGMNADAIAPIADIKRRKRFFPLRSISAAAVLLLLAGCFFLLRSRYRYAHKQAAALAAIQPHQDVVPGSNKALLTLADGTQVTLDSITNGTIAQQGNTKIVKQDAGQISYKGQPAERLDNIVYNTLSTPRGGKYQLRLPDGTSVWLNAASSIRYPVAFPPGKERIVALNGEAYFEVAANAGAPFYVHVQQLQVQVLGTHLNIMAYNDESLIRTTLLQGAVRIVQGDEKVMLQPGQEACAIRTGGHLKVAQADVAAAVAWKEGLFHYSHTDMATIMRQLSRWYDVDVQYEENLKDIYFSGQVSRNNTLSQVLKMFQLTKAVQFEITGKHLTVHSMTADAAQHNDQQ